MYRPPHPVPHAPFHRPLHNNSVAKTRSSSLKLSSELWPTVPARNVVISQRETVAVVPVRVAVRNGGAHLTGSLVACGTRGIGGARKDDAADSFSSVANGSEAGRLGDAARRCVLHAVPAVRGRD